MARLDKLTGIRNKNAFMEYTASIDEKLKSGMDPEPFAFVMCDVNDLKLLNDTRGHSFGDEAIRRASRMVCDVFEHSPVFRVGGDEFAVISPLGIISIIVTAIGLLNLPNLFTMIGELFGWV